MTTESTTIVQRLWNYCNVLSTTADMPGVEPGLIEGQLQSGFRMAGVSLHTPMYRQFTCS